MFVLISHSTWIIQGKVAPSTTILRKRQSYWRTSSQITPDGTEGVESLLFFSVNGNGVLQPFPLSIKHCSHSNEMILFFLISFFIISIVIWHYFIKVQSRVQWQPLGHVSSTIVTLMLMLTHWLILFASWEVHCGDLSRPLDLFRTQRGPRI